jgi:hypothetical protein
VRELLRRNKTITSPTVFVSIPSVVMLPIEAIVEGVRSNTAIHPTILASIANCKAAGVSILANALAIGMPAYY